MTREDMGTCMRLLGEQCARKIQSIYQSHADEHCGGDLEAFYKRLDDDWRAHGPEIIKHRREGFIKACGPPPGPVDWYDHETGEVLLEAPE